MKTTPNKLILFGSPIPFDFGEVFGGFGEFGEGQLFQPGGYL